MLCLLPVPLASAQEDIELGNLILDNQAGDISVRFGVHISTLDDLEAELASGSTVGLTCKAKVNRRKSLWADARVAGTRWVSSLSKDVLTGDYILKIPGAEHPVRGKDLAQLLAESWGNLNLDLGPWENLYPGYDYTLDLRISLDRLDVPSWMRYVLFFRSFDVYQPASYQLEFNY